MKKENILISRGVDFIGSYLYEGANDNSNE